MKLHEGTLIRRTVIQYNEQSSAATKRTLLDILSWLGTEYKDMLNKIVLYMTVHVDETSDAIATDTLILDVKTYGMDIMKRVTKPGDDSAVPMSVEIEVPLATVGTPSPGTNVLLKARATQWLITETLTYLIEVNAYLMDVGPSELLVRTF